MTKNSVLDQGNITKQCNVEDFIFKQDVIFSVWY